MVSAVGKEGSQRRASMSSGPNSEFAIVMVIMAVVGHKQSACRC